MTTSNTNQVIVSFHIGRGGRFNNAGHVSFIGEMDFQEILSLQSNHLYEVNRNPETGKFCKTYYADASGNEILTKEEFESVTGTLNFDNEYDTYTSMLIEDCSEDSIELVAKSTDVKSQELIDFLKNYNEDWKFDNYGRLITETEDNE